MQGEPQVGNLARPVAGQHLGDHLVYAELAPDTFGRGAVITVSITTFTP
jgi:hypothetical protein